MRIQTAKLLIFAKTGYLKWIARYIADCPKERNEGHFSKKLITFFEKFRQLRSCVRGQFQEQYDGGMICAILDILSIMFHHRAVHDAKNWR